MSNSITEFDGENLGGGWKVSLVDIAGVDWSVFPEEIDNNYEDAITLLDGYAWIEFLFTPDTLGYNEDKAENNGFVTKVTGIIPKDRADVLRIFEEEEHKRHLIIFHNLNVDNILIGRKHEHVRLDVVKRSSGEVPLERNQYAVVFTCLNRRRNAFYGYVPDVESDACVCTSNNILTFTTTVNLAEGSNTITHALGVEAAIVEMLIGGEVQIIAWSIGGDTLNEIDVFGPEGGLNSVEINVIAFA
jgi:hypothetical protein